MPASRLSALAAALMFVAPAVLADAPTASEIRDVVKEALETFNTPGMAVGIVKDGEVVHLMGYGVRDIYSKEKVDADTLFRIASTTKAFTSSALAILVDEGKLSWDDKVIDHLPDFRMFDPWVTREFTVRDLLVHNSGLGSGAGDLMLWPEPSGFSRDEIIKNLRHLKPVTSFRSSYAYDNLLYIVAGEVVKSVSGMSWEDFVQNRILGPLGMGCYSGDVPDSALANVATPHGMMDGKLVTIPRNAIGGKATVSAAAGGMVCNVRGMSTWMLTQLRGGEGPNGVRVFSEDRRDEMWASYTILPVSKSMREKDDTHFRTYGLAWRKADVHGHEVISHTGTLSGMQAYLTLVPELDLGLIVLNNGSNYGARTAVTNTIIKAYMDQPEHDWVKDYHDAQLAYRARVAEEEEVSTKGSGQMFLSLEAYMGTYRDAWLGEATVMKDGDGLRFSSRKSVQLTGMLEPYEQNTFIVRWDNRMMGADAYVRFETDFDGNAVGITMRPVSPDTDFSFDFQDLDFKRVE
ncbi:serine hydrolase [Kordiimonas sp.]|uniref:serine hydrolase n=1 Tax=Kordiimonas sp. TaxID=1970157 RepID=UPI003A91D35F